MAFISRPQTDPQSQSTRFKSNTEASSSSSESLSQISSLETLENFQLKRKKAIEIVDRILKLNENPVITTAPLILSARSLSSNSPIPI